MSILEQVTDDSMLRTQLTLQKVVALFLLGKCSGYGHASVQAAAACFFTENLV